MLKGLIAGVSVALAWGRMGPAEEAVHVPSLPGLDEVLTKASGRMQDFAHKAKSMREKVAEKQRDSEKLLEEKRVKYEGTLKEMSGENQQLAEANEALQKDVKSLKRDNEELRRHASLISTSNEVMRTSIDQLQTKMRAAADFLSETMKISDSSQEEKLNVLKPTKRAPTLATFLSEVGHEPSHLALLQPGRLNADVVDSPAKLVAQLTASLQELASAEKDGEAQLAAHFKLISAEIEEKRLALVQEQKMLTDSKASQQRTNEELKAAKDQLSSMHYQLKQRLQGIRIFVRKVDNETVSTFHSGNDMLTPSKEGATEKTEAKTTQVAQKAHEWKHNTGSSKAAENAEVAQSPEAIAEMHRDLKKHISNEAGRKKVSLVDLFANAGELSAASKEVDQPLEPVEVKESSAKSASWLPWR